jgi:hypothetical protein
MAYDKSRKKGEIDYGKLACAHQAARRQLEPYRREHTEAVRQYVGGHWSDEDRKKHVPVNFLSLYVSVMSRSLVPKSPRVLLTTFSRQSLPAVSAMQSWCNEESRRMNLGETLRKWVTNGLFSVGILKVALSAPGDAVLTGWNVKSGIPFAEVIPLEDFTCDMHARSWDRLSFVGHRYRVPVDVAEAMRGRKKPGDRDITPSMTSDFNEQGDEKASKLGQGSHGNDSEEFEDYVDLWEIYLPRHRKVCTFLAEDFETGGACEPIHTADWLGPDCGPYHFLQYGIVPDNLMGKSPIMDLIDLHMTGNNAFRKIERQARRMKQITAVNALTPEDGDKVREAKDGDIVPVANPEGVRPLMTGGPDNLMTVFFMQCKDLFSWLAGGLDILGGLGTDNPTATQDKILNANSSRTVADMQERTVDAIAEAYRSLSWYWWHHPELVMRVREEVPGLPGKFINRTVYPDSPQAPVGANVRKGEFQDLDLQVDPYSMQHRTPMERLTLLRSVLQQDVLPILQLYQQQGVELDLTEYMKLVSEYGNIPELNKLLTIGEPMQTEPSPGSGGGGEGPGMPANTTRTYERVNKSERSSQGNNRNLMTALMGVNPGGNANTANGTMNGNGR